MKHDETPCPSVDDKPNDTEGHGYKWADAETPEGEDNTEGDAVSGSTSMADSVSGRATVGNRSDRCFSQKKRSYGGPR